MHSSVYRFFADVSARYPVSPTDRVLECGALNVNGSIRPLFDACREYIGLDERDGPGVDTIANCHALPFPAGRFDWVLSSSMLEHDPKFWRSMAEMQRVLRPGGLLVVTAPGFGWPRHDEPIDCYRFSAASLRLLVPLCEVVLCDEANEGDGPDVRLLARRTAPLGAKMVA